ncbi:transposable element Tcb1 transposase [Trichonephila clavipes]|nr:transposable element Tcb1 transposase [Trichonephila clavipes]
MTQRKPLDDFLRGRIIGRPECGCTQLGASEELGIAQSVIARLWKRFQDYGDVSRRYSPGRPPVTAPKEDQYLAVTAKKKKTDPHSFRPVSSALFTHWYYSFKSDQVQTLKVYMLLDLSDVFLLTATHCSLRLAWNTEHALWTPQQWACVIFSDESKFSLQSDSHRTFIWRAPGIRYHQETIIDVIIEHHRYSGAGLLV